VPSGRITSILNDKRGINADKALRLARHLGTSAPCWLNLQTSYDLATAERQQGARIAAEVERAARARARPRRPGVDPRANTEVPVDHLLR
jgi:plasmid maintenance system antidote protein VapI